MITRMYTLAIALLLGVSAHASEGTAYATLDAAVGAAMIEAHTMAPKHEAGGSVYQCGAVYAYKAPVTQHKRTGVDIPVYTLEGCTLAAVYHTHPKGDAMFSVPDIKAACALKTVSYIGPVNGDIRKLDCSALSNGAVYAMLSEGRTSGVSL